MMLYNFSNFWVVVNMFVLLLLNSGIFMVFMGLMGFVILWLGEFFSFVISCIGGVDFFEEDV